MEKTLHNSDASGARQNVPDIKVVGNGDMFRLLCKASSQNEGTGMKHLVQLHHQFPDGSTDFRVQLEVDGYPEVEAALREAQASHPLPDGATWLLCTEGATEFMWAVEDAGGGYRK